MTDPTVDPYWELKTLIGGIIVAIVLYITW